MRGFSATSEQLISRRIKSFDLPKSDKESTRQFAEGTLWLMCAVISRRFASAGYKQAMNLLLKRGVPRPRISPLCPRLSQQPFRDRVSSISEGCLCGLSDCWRQVMFSVLWLLFSLGQPADVCLLWTFLSCSYLHSHRRSTNQRTRFQTSICELSISLVACSTQHVQHHCPSHSQAASPQQNNHAAYRHPPFVSRDLTRLPPTMQGCLFHLKQQQSLLSSLSYFYHSWVLTSTQHKHLLDQLSFHVLWCSPRCGHARITRRGAPASSYTYSVPTAAAQGQGRRPETGAAGGCCAENAHSIWLSAGLAGTTPLRAKITENRLLVLWTKNISGVCVEFVRLF